MRCKNCGNTIADGSKFCSQCGSKVEEETKICSQCGHELRKDEIFCSQCGTKYGAVQNSSQIDEIEDDEETELVGKLGTSLQKILQEKGCHGNLIPLLGLDIYENPLQKELALQVLSKLKDNNYYFDGKKITQEDFPIFFSDYNNEFIKKQIYSRGFILTTRGIRANYEEKDNTRSWRLIPYESIVKVEYEEFFLSQYMEIYYGENKSMPIFIDNMDNPECFVEAFQDFLCKNNFWTHDMCRRKEIEKIVRQVCKAESVNSRYLKISDDLDMDIDDCKQCEAARINFKISDDKELYLIYDSTILGSMKSGLVLAGDKIYCKDGAKYRAYKWDEFLVKDISAKGGNIIIGDEFSLLATGDSKNVVRILNTIRERIKALTYS